MASKHRVVSEDSQFEASVSKIEQEEARAEKEVQAALEKKELFLSRARKKAEELIEKSREEGANEASVLIKAQKKAVDNQVDKILAKAKVDSGRISKNNSVSKVSSSLFKSFEKDVFSLLT
ncbi:MAG: hypothetical protein ACE5DI_05390 [Candidatus Micrarchaeia archaeon]